MKTLEQRIETELSTSLYLCSDFNEIKAEFLRLTRAWLTQKRRELKVFENGEILYNLKLELYKELLEELK
jgi:hypothetical protein